MDTGPGLIAKNDMTLHEIIEEIKEMERDIRFPEDLYEAGKKDAYCAVLDLLTKEEAEQPALPEGLEETQKKDWYDKYNEDVDAVFGSSRYSEQGLEEAAEKFAHIYDMGTCDGIAQDAFKAGAKWQAEQKTDPFSPVQPGPGYGSYATTKIGTMDESGFNYEEEVVLDEDGFPCIKTINFHDYDPDKPLFKPGDKVIVQIRRKDE